MKFVFVLIRIVSYFMQQQLEAMHRQSKTGLPITAKSTLLANKSIIEIDERRNGSFKYVIVEGF